MKNWLFQRINKIHKPLVNQKIKDFSKFLQLEMKMLKPQQTVPKTRRLLITTLKPCTLIVGDSKSNG